MSKKIVIGCDFDGTLTDLFGFYKEHGEKFFNKKIVNKNGYGLKKMFDVTTKEEIKFGLRYFIKYCKDGYIRPGASELLNKEKEKGSSIHAITARMYAAKQNLFGAYMRKLCIRYAVNNGVLFDSFEFAEEKYTLRDKYISCHKLGVNVMIDDLPEVALYLADKDITIALIDTPYNQGIKHKNITRCYNFKDVAKVIDKVRGKVEDQINDFKILGNDEVSKLKKKELNKYYTDYKNYYKNEYIDKKSLELGKKRYKIIIKIINLLMLNKLFVKVKNKENIPYQDGLIIVSNHLDSNDQFIIAYALKNKYLTGYASSTIENTLRGKLGKYTNSAIFVDRDSVDSKKNAKKEFDLRIENGYNSLVFPEGTRKNKYSKYDNKELLDFKLGAFSSSMITGAPILPVVIYKKKKNSKKVTLIVGEVFFVNKDENLKESAKNCEKIIKKMLKSERN